MVFHPGLYPQIGVQGAIVSPPPSSSITPLTYSPTVWYKPSGFNCSGACSNGNQVSTWADSSGNANTLTLSGSGSSCTYNTGQLNGFAGLTNTNCVGTFGTAITWATSITVFAVFSHATLGGDNMAFISGATNPYFVHRIDTSTLHQTIVIPGVAVVGTGTATLAASTFYQINASYTSGTGAYILRAASAADGSGTNAHSITSSDTGTFKDIGSGNDLFNGVLIELLVYKPALTGTQINNIEAYYRSTYGIL